MNCLQVNLDVITEVVVEKINVIRVLDNYLFCILIALIRSQELSYFLKLAPFFSAFADNRNEAQYTLGLYADLISIFLLLFWGGTAALLYCKGNL